MNKRAYDAWLMRKNGHTYAEIGKHFGVTAGRAKGLVDKYKEESKKEAELDYYAEFPPVARNFFYRCGFVSKAEILEKLSEGIVVREIGAKNLEGMEKALGVKLGIRIVKEPCAPNYWGDTYRTIRVLMRVEEEEA